MFFVSFTILFSLFFLLPFRFSFFYIGFPFCVYCFCVVLQIDALSLVCCCVLLGAF